jgi:DnaK suppressor protein
VAFILQYQFLRIPECLPADIDLAINPRAGGEGGSNGMKGKANGHKHTRTARGRDSAKPLPPNYRPTQGEPFMNPVMRQYFKQKLLFWRNEILREAGVTMQSLQTESLHEPDLTDRASLETDISIALRTRDRERKLLSKIDAALRRIEDGTYGYCEETGEPISIRRLEARPIATLSVEAQERHERLERTMRDD